VASGHFEQNQAAQIQKSNVMNEDIPPLTINTPPKTSALAVWSLVLGILSLACFSIFAAIPGVICGHKALSRIKYSDGRISGQGLAIGGLVTGYLGIAWAIFMIPLMMAIAIPNFVKARETAQANACINNLRQIDAAKNEWALENNKTTNDIPTAQDLDKYIKSGFASLHCPAGGTYTIGHVGEPPACSLSTNVTPAHVLP
jgi:competence protein ComGC